jgi:hypothetical protein
MIHRLIVLGLTTAAILTQACSTPTPPPRPSTPQAPSAQSTASGETRPAQADRTSSRATSKRHQTVGPTRKTPAKAITAGAAAAKGQGREKAFDRDFKSTRAGTLPGLSVGQTSEERRLQLEREFGASLADFDRRLLREKELLRRTGATGQSNASGDSGATSSGGQAAFHSPASARDTASSGSMPEDQRGAASFPSGATPPNIPRGQDDDIVARQLREAAENETDPVLRKKLWEEYRKYKNATATQSGSSP